MAHSADDIRSHVKVYIGVFVTLLILTIVTVAVSYLDLPIGPSVIVALMIAGVKGSLVAMFFMHLKGEKPIVMWSLALTAVFVLFVFALPMWTEGDHIVGTRPNAWSAGTDLPVAPEHSPAPAH